MDLSPENPILEEETEIVWDFKCCLKGCTRLDQPLKCCIETCPNHLHTNCALQLRESYLAGLAKPSGTSLHLLSTDIVCSKRCFNKLLKKKIEPPKTSTTRFWGNDGPTPFVSSMSILMDWLTTGSNYSKWRGGDKHSGMTKKTLSSTIGALIKEQIGVTRAPKDVQNKIECIEQDFCSASDWLAQTGAGLESGEVKSYISKTWPLYYDMEPIMKDRASTKPILSEGTAFEDNSSEFSLDDSEKELNTPIAKRTRHDSNKKKPVEKRISSLRKASPSVMNYDSSEKLLFDLKKSQIENESKYQFDDLTIRKADLEDRKAEREANNMLAFAQAEKFDAEAKIATIMAKVTLMHECKKLIDDGFSQSDVDLLLPME